MQDAYSLRCAPQVLGAARDALAHAERVAAAELEAGDRQPDGAARRARRVVRQLPRRAARLRLRLPRDRRRRGRRDRRAPHRPPARRHALAGPAAVPRRRPGRQLGADDRPLHAGGDGRREPPPRRAGERRLAADERDAGGPRLDGLGRGAQAARGSLDNLGRILAVELTCAAHGLDLRAPLQPGPGAAAARCAALRSAVAGPGRPLAGARARRRRGAGRRARSSPPSRAWIGGSR